jgi:hypothetical protein
MITFLYTTDSGKRVLFGIFLFRIHFENYVPSPVLQTSDDDETSFPHPLAPPKFSKIKFQKITPKFPTEIQPPKLLRFFSRYNFAKKIKIAKIRHVSVEAVLGLFQPFSPSLPFLIVCSYTKLPLA